MMKNWFKLRFSVVDVRRILTYLSISQQRKLILKRYLRMLYHGYRWSWLGMLLCMIAVAILEPSIAYLLKPVFDSGNVATESFIAVKYLPYVFIITYIALAVSSYGSDYLGGWINTNLQQDLRQQMTGHLLSVPIATLNAESMGTTTTRFMHYVPQFVAPTRKVFINLLQEPLKIIFYFAQMMYLQWQLALIICVVAPLVMVLTLYLKQRSKKLSSSIQQETAHAQSRLNESIQFIQMFKVHDTANVGNKVVGIFLRLCRVSLRYVKLLAFGQLVSRLIFTGPLLIIMIYVINAINSGQMTAGEAAAFFACVLFMQRSVQSITQLTVLLETMFVAGQAVFDFIDSKKEEDLGVKVIERARGDIVFDNLYLHYPQANGPALNGVSFSISAGETVALVGPSGAGKTSIANVLTRFYIPQQGQVRLDGNNIQELTLASLRNQIALVTQQPLLVEDTVAANVCWPEPPNADNQARIERALKDASASEFVANLPLQSNTLIGENGSSLSGGEQQRLALARVFYRDVPVVILDEPTSALDNITEMKIRNVIQQLLSGRSALIIAHRLSIVDCVDRVLVLDQGKVIAEGDSKYLLKTCLLYRQLYQAQQLA